MDQLSQAIQQMIVVSPEELESFLKQCHTERFARKALLIEPGKVPDRIFFINKGILRVMALPKS